MAKKFFITTPIYYVNDVPHIGHACTTVATDIIARYHRALGDEVFFLTGTDEHGAKVAQAAKDNNLSPQEFCDKVSQNYREIWPKLNIRYDYFIRTTNPQHIKIVQEIIDKIYKGGDIYKAKYEGLYCVGCEKFLVKTDLVNDRCPLHPNKEIQKQKEDNYFFKLSKYAPRLIEAIENPNDKNYYRVSPLGKREEVLSKLKTGVNDISISRANVSWGIPLPWDQTQTIYVWFDALLNYYTATKITDREDFWPASLHLVGKEILWFHAVIWEAMLLAAGVSLPKEIFAHSFYIIDEQKMSKSLGNIISPEDLLKKFGADGTRYLIASSFPYNNDSDVGWGKFTEKYNADLANGLGNLVARVAKLAEQAKLKVRSSKFEVTIQNPKFDGYHKLLNEYQFNETLSFIWEKISQADRYVDINKPWELKGVELEKVLNHLVSEIREIAILLEPFLPETAQKIQKQFAGPEIKVTAPLFPRLQ